jgi:hypothetical protein
MCFTTSKDMWKRENSGLYKYITVYVGVLLIAASNPNSIVKTLQEKQEILENGTYVMDQGSMEQYENMFGCKPQEYTLPLEKSDHTKVDFSDE